MRETEAEFASWLEDALSLRGWRWVHARPARTAKGWRTAISGAPGFPDYVAVRRERVIFIEIKGTNGWLADDQREWVRALQQSTEECYVWWPSNREIIEEILR